MKKDRKILTILFSIEAFMLVVLLIVTIMTTSPSSDLRKDTDMDSNVPGHFHNSLYLNYFSANSSSANSTVVKDAYNYYTFNLTSDGITSNLYTDKTGLTTGLASSSLSESQITIQAAYKASAPTILEYGNLRIQNPYLRKNLSLQEVLSEPLQIKKITGDKETSVIVYHTHTREAYCVTEADRSNVKASYNESNDNTRNVVAAGNDICSVLSTNKIGSIHDTTVHYEKWSNGKQVQDCYDSGIHTLRGLLDKYQEAQLVIDLHRDGVTNPQTDKIRHYTTVRGEDGTEYAQIMLVVGLNYLNNNEVYTEGDEFNPYWKENFKLALLVIEKLEEKVPGITRGISLRREAYNQHLAPNTLLVEMGFDGNLVSEASASSKLLGEVLTEIYS